MVDPLNYGAMLVSGSPLAQPAAGSGIPNQYQIQQFTPYSDPFATGYLNPAYQNTSKVNPGYGPNGELIDTITGRRINQFGFNNPYKTYEANVPSWMRDTAASEGMAGRYGITPAYQTALDNLKLNEYKMFLHQNDPDLMQRARRGEGYVQAYQNLAPLQVQKDVAEGRATYDQGKAYLMLHGEPGDVVRGFAGDVSNWKNQLTNAQNELQGYKKELASYGNDPQYEVQRRSLVSRIANMENELIPRWQQTLAEREEAAKGYEGALQGYAPNLGPAPYSEMATASGETARMERDALAAYRAQLEEANRQAEEASQLYKRTAGADWTEERNAALHQDVINTRNAITDFIEATRSDAFAKGGFAVKPVWEKKRPKDLGKPKSLSVKKKKAAKARAAAAGRPYPNLVDNLAVARKKGK